MAESNRQRRSFPDAFKLEAVAAVRDGRSVSQVAAELGLPDRLLRAWLRWAEGRAAAAWARFEALPQTADQAAEIARLRRELDRVRMERDILRQAALIFGQATGRR